MGLREPSVSAILVASTEAASGFARRNGAPGPDGWLADWIRGPLRMPPSIVDTLDHQVVSVVRRAIGFPLLAATAGWGDDDAAELDFVETQQFVWLDERAARLPRHFDPLDTAEIAWVAALAIHEGIIVSGPEGFTYLGPAGSTIGELLSYLMLLDRRIFRRLNDEVWKHVQDRTIEQWEQAMPAIESDLETRSVATERPADRAAWTQVRTAVRARFNTFLTAESPSVSTLWPQQNQAAARID